MTLTTQRYCVQYTMNYISLYLSTTYTNTHTYVFHTSSCKHVSMQEQKWNGSRLILSYYYYMKHAWLNEKQMKTQKKSSSHILRFLKSWEKMFCVNSHQEVLNLRRSKCTFIKEYHIFQRLQLTKCNLYEIPCIKKITNF